MTAHGRGHTWVTEVRIEQAWICVLEKEAKSHSSQLGSRLGNPTALAEADCLRAQAGKDASREKGDRDKSLQVPPRTARKGSACSATVSPGYGQTKGHGPASLCFRQCAEARREGYREVCCPVGG